MKDNCFIFFANMIIICTYKYYCVQQDTDFIFWTSGDLLLVLLRGILQLYHSHKYMLTSSNSQAQRLSGVGLISFETPVSVVLLIYNNASYLD